jgi:hypothetical protein
MKLSQAPTSSTACLITHPNREDYPFLTFVPLFLPFQRATTKIRGPTTIFMLGSEMKENATADKEDNSLEMHLNDTDTIVNHSHK